MAKIIRFDCYPLEGGSDEILLEEAEDIADELMEERNYSKIVHTLMDNDRLSINREEAENLMNFFYHVGYISYDEHQPTHQFIQRLKKFLEF